MNQEYTQRLQKIEAELDRWLPEKPDSDWAEKIFPNVGNKVSAESLQALVAPGRDILSRGGKRWRPLLMTLVCEGLGGGDAAIPLTPLVELCHNASLIHDDIEDDSDERRGKPAAHIIYGIDAAVNSGSFLYFLAVCCIESAAQNKERVYKIWAECLQRLHFGQAMDISWHRDIALVPTIDEYYAMCGLKTGSLARLAAELGAYAAGCADDVQQQMGEAAEKLGIGFQILDDVKNLTNRIPGKMQADDIIEGKKSLPILMYLDKYPEHRGRIFSCFYEAKMNGPAAPEVGELIEILTETGVLAEAEKKGHSLIEEARGVFRTSGSDALMGLIDFIS